MRNEIGLIIFLSVLILSTELGRVIKRRKRSNRLQWTTWIGLPLFGLWKGTFYVNTLRGNFAVHNYCGYLLLTSDNNLRCLLDYWIDYLKNGKNKQILFYNCSKSSQVFTHYLSTPLVSHLQTCGFMKKRASFFVPGSICLTYKNKIFIATW